MFYHVPVPAGTYTVKLHIAETFTGNRESGRLITITVNGKKKKNLNPVVFSGGFATAGCVSWSGINAEDELITISMEGSPLLNGSEIRKEKTDGGERVGFSQPHVELNFYATSPSISRCYSLI